MAKRQGLTIRSSRLRFVPAKQWQKKLATVLPPLRFAGLTQALALSNGLRNSYGQEHL